MEAIDVSENEREQDGVASIDGDDESESSGSEEDGDDDLLSISDRDDSDSEDQEDSGIESSPISTYDPISAAILLSSSAPSPSMMTGRLGVTLQLLQPYICSQFWSFSLPFRSLLLTCSFFFHAHETRNSYLVECSSSKKTMETT